MMKNGDGMTERNKKLYAKPEVKIVQLRPEEAVLGNCKVAGVGVGPDGPCSITCKTQGS